MNSATQAAVVDFASYTKTAAKRFLRTAVLIDDDIQVAVTHLASPPDTVVTPPFVAASGTAADRPSEPSVKELEAPDGQRAAGTKQTSDISLKPLADAFLDQHIVCGVLKPAVSDEPETVIRRAVESAVVADIFIIDWYLRQNDADMAKEILARVLENDRQLNGRLRLVIIYTSATPLEQRCTELKQFLEGRSFLTEVSEGAIPCMTVSACRIRFVQKPFGALGMAAEALPEFAISQFSDQAKGLMPAFALTGIAALREATHHLLATFGARLDPAFVGHRMLLQQPEDSREFALSVLMLQIRGLLSLPHFLGSALSEAEIGAWFDDRYAGAETDAAFKKLNVTKDNLRAAVMSGNAKANVTNLHTALFVSAEADKPQSRETKISADFARLTTFVREYSGFNQLPSDWVPTLTLGTVLRLKENNISRFFLSVQPLCDTVRIDAPRFFQFAELKPRDNQDSDFWLVVQEGSERLQLRVDQRAGSRYYDEFAPHQATRTIRASLTESKIFIFKNQRGNDYEWVGDIDRVKAQKAANDLSAVLARVGLDEYEWLRRGARAKSSS